MSSQKKVGRKYTKRFLNVKALSIAKPLSYPPARKNNKLQILLHVCQEPHLTTTGKSFPITHHILHVGSFFHSINIYWASTERLAEAQCFLPSGPRDSFDSISEHPWRNPEKGYSLYWLLPPGEAYCGRVAILGLSSKTQHSLYVFTVWLVPADM